MKVYKVEPIIRMLSLYLPAIFCIFYIWAFYGLSTEVIDTSDTFLMISIFLFACSFCFQLSILYFHFIYSNREYCIDEVSFGIYRKGLTLFKILREDIKHIEWKPYSSKIQIILKRGEAVIPPVYIENYESFVKDLNYLSGGNLEEIDIRFDKFSKWV